MGLSAGAPGPIIGANAWVNRFNTVEMMVPGMARTVSAKVGCGTTGLGGGVGANTALNVFTGDAVNPPLGAASCRANT